MTVSQPARVLRITFPYSAAEHAEAISQSVAGSRLLKWLRFCALSFPTIGLVSGLAAVVIGKEPVASVVANLWPFLPLGAFWYWVAPAILNAVYKRQFGREAIREGRDVETISLGPDGISPGAKWSHLISWSQVKRVVETERLIVIDASSDGPTYVPKLALSAADLTNIETMLRGEFRDRPEDLRLMSENRRHETERIPGTS